MKIFIFGLSLLGLLACADCVAWTSKCINTNRLTFNDSEAGILEHELRQMGKHLLPQPEICTITDIPLYLRKFDE